MEKTVTAPFNYVSSLKSKGVRNKLIMALNSWVLLDAVAMEWVMSIVTDIHNTSLL